MEGLIIAYGKMALTIQSENKQQFYALFENVDETVMKLLGKTKLNVPVKFKVDYTKFNGKTNYGKRFHALNVELQDLVI
jgi:hypothetical protein